MLPLRTPADLKKFPSRLLFCICLSLLLTILFSHSINSSDSLFIRMLVSGIIFPSVPLGILCLWYLWIFYPSFQLRDPQMKIMDFINPAVAFFLTGICIHYQVEASVSFIFTLLIFGNVMRNLIWDNVDTLVFGPKLFSIYAVPSYVHLFFFYFYLFICQLLRPAYGMPGKTIYLVSLISFLVGFLLRSFEVQFLTGKGVER